jgi:hypothetical protein
MMPDAVHHVNFGEILQALAWEFRALEAPGYLLLLGAAAEAVAAVAAGGVDMVGKASVAANVLDGNFVRLGHLLQFILILILIGQVFGAGPAVKAADSDQLVLYVFHRISFLHAYQAGGLKRQPQESLPSSLFQREESLLVSSRYEILLIHFWEWWDLTAFSKLKSAI